MISLQLQEKKKKTINHSSWHNGAEQRILEFERLWNCDVGKFLFDLVLDDKKFMWSLGFSALSRLLRNRLVCWVQLECFLTNDGNVFGSVLSRRYMSVLASGAPNDRMFPNTSVVSQMVLFVLWRKPIYLFECLRGTLAISKVLGGFFVSSETVSYPDGFDWTFEEMQ